MASCITAQFGNNYCPQIRLTVNQTSSTNTTATLTWILEYVAHGYSFYLGNRTYTVVINGQTKTGTFYTSGVTSTTEITRGTITVNKTTSRQNISFSVSFPFNGTWNGVYSGTKSASGSISVDAKPSYTIKYNANGGSGAPSSQTKWYGTNITLSSSKPTRTGHSFLGWATNSSATSPTYAAGARYSANASVTLYAVWKANTYTVKYDANGGSGAPTNQTKTYGVTLTLSSTKPTRTNYNFKGWGTSAASTTVAYAPGASYTKNEAVTLYAIWEIAYIAPRITNVSADRCDSEGALSEDGTYALVKFSWACDKEVVSVKIEYKLASDSDFTSASITSSGTSGDVNEIIGGALDTEHLYNVRIVVSDSSGTSTLLTDVPAIAYTIDFLVGGKGVAFGKPAEQPGFDLSMNAILRKGYAFAKEMGDGTLTEMAILRNRSDDGLNESGASYYGLVLPSGDNGKIRTPSEGLIPYRSGGASSIGNSDWPFNAGYFKDIFVNGRNVFENKVLWSGAWYMNASHRATLSEAITKQPTGICLVFSSYSNGSVQNWDFNIFFVPKQQITHQPGVGHAFTMSHSLQNNFAVKYLYIQDTNIVGNDNNVKTGTGDDGIKYTNSAYVLRYVIGV